MNLEQIRIKLNNVSKSTATKHPKVLISELCGVVKFLLDEISRIKSLPMTLLKRLPEDIHLERLPPADPFVISPPPPPDEPVRDYPPERGYQPRKRYGNATEAE